MKEEGDFIYTISDLEDIIKEIRDNGSDGITIELLMDKCGYVPEVQFNRRELGFIRMVLTDEETARYFSNGGDGYFGDEIKTILEKIRNEDNYKHTR